MAEVHHFQFGAISPSLAAVSAIAGCVLGIILSTKARKAVGAPRARLVTYATLALGLSAVWQSTVVALLGLGVPESTLRLDPLLLAAGLVVAIAAVGGALFLVTLPRQVTGRIRPARVTAAGALMAIGVAGTQALVLAAIRTGGVVGFDWRLFAVAIALAVVTAIALLLFVMSTRALRPAVAGGLGTGLALCGTHYVGEYALQIDLAGRPGWVSGIAPMYVAVPTMVFGAVMIAMMFFFTVGSATRRDLHVIFSPDETSIEIESWMIEAVTARIANTPPASEPARVSASSKLAIEGRAGGTRAIPSVIAWRSLPVPGHTAQRDRHARDVSRNDKGIVHGTQTTPAAAPVSPAPVAPARALTGGPIASPATGAVTAAGLPMRQNTATRPEAPTRPHAPTRPEPPTRQDAPTRSAAPTRTEEASTVDGDALPRRRNVRWESP